MDAAQKQNEGFFAFASETAKAVRESFNEPLEMLTKPLLRDGTLAAAFRQGIDELGEALKPFPQSIQVQESGSIWNPTQGEIAAARTPDEQPSPSEIADGHGVHGTDRGQERGGITAPENYLSNLPSPSEIA